MSNQIIEYFCPPKEHKESLVEGLEVDVAVVLRVRVQDDIPKHLETKIVHYTQGG